MKKDFLDFLYNEKAKVEAEVEKLVIRSNQPQDGSCEGCGCPIKAELAAKRDHLGFTNQTIQEYLTVHNL